jgi:hypothetical protein
VDGLVVRTVDELYARLADARRGGRRATLTFKRFSGGDTLFSYSQRTLLVSELRIIGPQNATLSAER